MGKAKIKLVGRSPKDLENVCRQIVEIAKITGVNMSGPIAFPTKKLEISTRKTPCGDGTETYEHWQMRIHQRYIEIAGDERTLRQIMRVKVPDSVSVKIVLQS